MSSERQGAEEILASLHYHPRVAFQGLASTEDHLRALRGSLPVLHAFGGVGYAGLLPVVDWDHRIPSRLSVLRIYAYYSEATLRAGRAGFQSRMQQIRALDHYPEFDVPDFAGLTADEAYDIELDGDATILKVRLVSAWRREIEPQLAQLAVSSVRASEHFRKLSEETRGQRPDYLGDLESVSWTPPCESNLACWTVDVWYLMYLDASIGKGRSFLVDLSDRQVVGVREFVVRSS